MDGIGVAYGKHSSEAQGSRLFLPYHSEGTEVNALASDTVWTCTCVIEEDMGQIIEQCTFETTKQPVKLDFGKPKLGLCSFSPPQYCRAASKDKIKRLKTENCWEADLQSMVTKYVYWQCCSATAAIEERRKTPQHSKITAVTTLSSVWTHVSRLSAWTLMLRKHKCLMQSPASWQIDISNAQPGEAFHLRCIFHIWIAHRL